MPKEISAADGGSPAHSRAGGLRKRGVRRGAPRMTREANARSYRGSANVMRSPR